MCVSVFMRMCIRVCVCVCLQHPPVDAVRSQELLGGKGVFVRVCMNVCVGVYMCPCVCDYLEVVEPLVFEALEFSLFGLYLVHLCV